jgi:hypothetical protein
MIEWTKGGFRLTNMHKLVSSSKSSLSGKILNSKTDPDDFFGAA